MQSGDAIGVVEEKGERFRAAYMGRVQGGGHISLHPSFFALQSLAFLLCGLCC